jgi:hypothetical protein
MNSDSLMDKGKDLVSRQFGQNLITFQASEAARKEVED